MTTHLSVVAGDRLWVTEVLRERGTSVSGCDGAVRSESSAVRGRLLTERAGL